MGKQNVQAEKVYSVFEGWYFFRVFPRDTGNEKIYIYLEEENDTPPAKFYHDLP